MVKLVDMPDLGSGAARRVGSSPIIRTKKLLCKKELFFIYVLYQMTLTRHGFYFIIILKLKQ